MKLFKLCLLIAALCVMPFPMSALAANYSAVLNGLQETPPNASPGTGIMILQLNSTQDTLFFQLRFTGLECGTTAAHIHLGVAGVAGPVLFPLPDFPTGVTSGQVAGSWLLSPQNIVELNAESLYVNIHTTCNPGGEIRGQIIPCGDTPEFVTLPTPAQGHSSGCIHLCPGWNVIVFVPGLTQDERPHAVFTPGCTSCGNDINDCTPVAIEYDDANWHYSPAALTWRYTILGQSEAGCFCFSIDNILPVEFGSFSAVGGDGHVALSWNTRSERDVRQFEIERGGQRVAVVPSQGNSPTGHSYQWTDRRVQNGAHYRYTLIEVDLSGTRTELAGADATPGATEVVTDYALHQNYPNPFNPSTTIAFDLIESGQVKLTVYNVLMQKVATLVNEHLEAGVHTVSWDASNLSSGVYICELKAGAFRATRKMLLMR